MQHRYIASGLVGLVFGGLVFIILSVSPYPFDQSSFSNSYGVKHTAASSLASEFGVTGAVASLSSDASKSTATSKITEAGFGWVRQEYTYSGAIDFTPYDAALTKTKAAGLKTLVLLAYPGSDKTHDDWKSYVTSVATHLGSDGAAYEIMNEIDNALSASDYVTYLSEARTIILAANSNATIVLSGLTSRQQATDFWDGVVAAGGWSMFDKIGLHVYHSGYPEKVNFGGGDLIGELDRVVGNINKNGGGKKIWITEIGYLSGAEGTTNQANWLARTLVMSKTVSSVEKMFLYHLYDGSGDAYGLLSTSLAEKPAFGTVKSTVGSLSGLSSATKLTSQAKTSLDAFDTVSGWSTDATSNGTTTLSGDTGHSGAGMKIAYSFTDSSAYAVAEKKIGISGTPTALAAWIYGDDTKNVWKFRFTDKNGETFQTDLGSISSGWSYKQFTIGTDTAFTSWGGDGKIDFPIAFNSIVIDRQGGAASASGKVDEIMAISGSADLVAYQFGSSNVAWWKVSGSDSTSLCGATREFREDPQYASNVNCSDTPASSSNTAAVVSATSSSSSTTKKAKTASPPPAPVADQTKSTIRVDGTAVPANDTTTYAIVITVKDASGTIITNQKPSITMSGGQTTASDVVLIGNEWIARVSSNAEGARTALVKVRDAELGSVTMTFVVVPVLTPAAKKSTPVQNVVAPVPPSAEVPVNRPVAISLGLATLALVLFVAATLRQQLLHRTAP